MINKDKKIIAISQSDKKICNILIYILMGILLIFNLITLLVNILLLILILPLSILGVFIIYNRINNYKIEIENDVITKTNIFNKKKVIGNISEITTYSEELPIVTVLNNNQKLFSFSIHGREDNKIFYEYLKSNYNFNIYINRLKTFQIIDDEINYKDLFNTKKINTKDLTLIKYKKFESNYKGIKHTTYTIIGYNNDKRLFKLSNVTLFKFKKIKEYCKEKNIKIKSK